MKTVTAFLGSARRRGLTCAAVRRFLNRLEQSGDVQGEIVFLSDYKVGVCRGCKSCFERGEERCPLKDDRDALIEKMMASDGVIFATPNYSFHVSGMMKVFLDRLGFVFHRPQFHGKTFTSLVAQGIHGGGKIVKYLDFAGAGLGFNVVKGSCITALEPMSEKNRQQMERALAKHSGRFHERLMQPARPAPSLFQLMVFRMGRTSIRQLLGDSNRDFMYYRDHGWFDSDYYYPTRLGALKRAAGAGFDWMAGHMFRKEAQ
jgi:multimeric flavodoxin WrbA